MRIHFPSMRPQLDAHLQDPQTQRIWVRRFFLLLTLCQIPNKANAYADSSLCHLQGKQGGGLPGPLACDLCKGTTASKAPRISKFHEETDHGGMFFYFSQKDPAPLNADFLLTTPNAFHVWPLNPNWRPAEEGMGAQPARISWITSLQDPAWPMPLYDLPFWTLNPTTGHKELGAQVPPETTGMSPLVFLFSSATPTPHPHPTPCTHTHFVILPSLLLARRQDVLWGGLTWKAPKSLRLLWWNNCPW